MAIIRILKVEANSHKGGGYASEASVLMDRPDGKLFRQMSLGEAQAMNMPRFGFELS